ncbi:Mandelate racemase/muconate lactonizing protein [Allomeiothermus silvanus DSM 9946]|uniref:Mandelate racemase/muconate lactonizing protein n=1 Tax=Allomeiothermus silvanus (strain ATCC 700542 / DSM 9946 / NBRC 106475 / NCIMB 13440 / VI-R2) TaxID=526227 RepID=D7B9Y2_ALLS1|nr:enolase C-terminal domain-like protein [Allomeiothermus silvanus]ADH62416.1 Mandelate racemase/muconate lactonizing protein [Allomeiothermus silvanus DSM 9946]
MAVITRITLRPFRLPLKGALRWGKSSELAALEHLLVEVELSDGAIGRAEIPPRPTIYGETVGSVQAALEYLTPRLLELDIEDTLRIRAVLEGLPCNHTAKGGLDTAIWEAWARSQGQELWEVLEPHHRRVRVSYILGIADPEEMLADAQAVYQAGVRVLKVKVGRDLAGDLERLALLREQFPDVELYADANETLPPEEAETYLREWAKAGLLYVEEPLPVEEVLARKRLRAAEILPIIADDSCFTLRDLCRELLLDTFDVLNLKPARSGITWTLEMLALVRSEGKRAMLGSQAQSSFGAWQTALLAFQEGVDEPSELSFHLKAEGGFLEFPPFREGWLYWEDLVRCRFDEAAFAKYAL